MSFAVPTSFIEQLQREEPSEDESHSDEEERRPNSTASRSATLPEPLIKSSAVIVSAGDAINVEEAAFVAPDHHEDALGVPVPLAEASIRSGAQLSRSTAAARGPEAAKFRVDGMTMTIPNPKFEAAQEQYDAMLRRLQVNQLAADQARSWISESELIPTIGILNDPTLRRRLDSLESDVREVLLNATYVRKPPQIADIRNQRFVFLFGAALESPIDALVEEFVVQDLGEAAGANLSLDDRQNRTEALADAVRLRFREALEKADYSELPVTREELQGIFASHLTDELVRMRRTAANVNALPFEAESDYDREQRTTYNAETVQANVVSAMSGWLDVWMEEASISDVLARPDDLQIIGSVITGAEKQRIMLYVNSLITGSDAGLDGPMPHVILRNTTLPTEASVAYRFAEASTAAFRIEAVIAGLAPRTPDLSEQDVTKLRAMQQMRLFSVDPTEEELQTRRVRALLEADTVRRSTEAQVARLEYETRRDGLTPVIDVPLVEWRQSTSAESLTLTAQLIEQHPNTAGQPALVNSETDHTFRWYYRANGSSPDRLLHTTAIPAGQRPVDTLNVMPNPQPSNGAYVGGAHAGFYRVEIVRDGDTSSVFSSNVAWVRVNAQCQRCNTRFEVGDGVPRSFGECEWRAAPIDTKTRLYRKGDAFAPYIAAFGSPAGGGAGSGNGYDWQDELDDSIVSPTTGALVVDDRALIDLSVVGMDSLRLRFFSYEGVVTSLSARLARAMRDRYGEAGLAAAQSLFINRLPSDRTQDALFIGVVYSMLDPPAKSSLQTAERRLAPVAAALRDATIMYNGFGENDTVQRAAVKRVLDQATDNADAADRFRVEILQRFSFALDTFDERLHLSEASVLAAADKASVAQTATELPLAAVLHAVIAGHTDALNVMRATASERRFFADIAGALSSFADFYRASAETHNTIDDAARDRVRRTGVPLVVIGAHPAHSTYRNSAPPSGNVVAFNESADYRKTHQRLVDAQRHYNTIMATAPLVDKLTNRVISVEAALTAAKYLDDDDERLERLAFVEKHVAVRVDAQRQLDEARNAVMIRPANLRAPLIRFNDVTIRLESVRVASAQLASMTANDVRTSPAWRFTNRALPLADAYTMFIDQRGQLRLAHRMAAATTRTNIETRAQKFIDDSFTDERVSVANELALASALGKPLGVEQSLWYRMGDLAQRNGIAATAQVAKSISRAGGFELGIVDWRGVHSELDAQPTPYNVTFKDGASAWRRRGSERMTAGYDFTSLNRRIEYLIYQYTRTPTRLLRERIERLALYYNVLAQFAPKLRSTAVLNVDDIERALGDISKPASASLGAIREAKRRRIKV